MTVIRHREAKGCPAAILTAGKLQTAQCAVPKWTARRRASRMWSLIQAHRKNMQMAVLAVLLATAFFLAACNDQGVSAGKISLDYLDAEIAVSGLTDEAFLVTVTELSVMETVSKDVEGTRSNGETVKLCAVGPTLATFLEAYGKTPADFTGVRFTASDGYAVEVPAEMLASKEIILAFMDGDKPFDEWNAPLRVVVVGERPMYWARMVSRIEFETGVMDMRTDKLVFLDTALPALGAVRGAYNETEGGDLVSTVDLLAAHGSIGGDKVYMEAADGLKKNETLDNFLKGYLKYTGEKTPQFCSPDLPEGMNMDRILLIRANGVLYFSLEHGAGILPERESGGARGLGFFDIIKSGGFTISDAYLLTNAAGGAFPYSSDELAEGVFLQDGGLWHFVAKDGLRIENVLSIEVGA
jgi:hypothetical protein